MDVFYMLPTGLGSDQSGEINSRDAQSPHRHILPAPLSLQHSVSGWNDHEKEEGRGKKKKGVSLLLK